MLTTQIDSFKHLLYSSLVLVASANIPLTKRPIR
jgi:hypothetical protein